MSKQEFAENVNMIFLLSDILEDYFLKMKMSKECKFDFKQKVNRVLESLRPICKMANNTLNEESFDLFDDDKKTLLHLISWHNNLTRNNISNESIIEYLEKFAK